MEGNFDVFEGDSTTSVGHQDTIASLFPHLYGSPSVALRATEQHLQAPNALKIGCVLSGGQAAGNDA